MERVNRFIRPTFAFLTLCDVFLRRMVRQKRVELYLTYAMDNIFSLLIIPNRRLGHIIMPYMITRGASAEFYQAAELVTLDNYEQSAPADDQGYIKELVKLVSYYEEQHLMKLFCKKKVTAKVFFDTLDEDLFSQHIRPHIDRQISKCLVIAEKYGIPMYRRDDRANLYPEDKVHFATEKAETVFAFTKSEDTLSYSLQLAVGDRSIALYNKYHVLLSNEPCHILIEDTLYHFPEIDGKKLKPFFDKQAVTVPPAFQEKYFEGFILNCIKKYSVKADGFSVEELHTVPVPQVIVEKDLAQKVCLQLYFTYGDKKYLYSNKVPFTVEMYRDGGYSYRKIFRNAPFEATICEKLKSWGIEFAPSGWLQPALDKEVLAWVSDNREFLLADGIEVTSDAGKSISLDAATIKLFVTANKDWFDVDALVMFGQLQVPFKVIRKYIAEGKREMPLSDGTVAIIPQEWFAQYGNLCRMSKENGESLHLSALHAGILPHENIEFADKDTFARIAQLSHDATDDVCLPAMLQASLRPYQHTGFQWMYHRYRYNIGACLADDMGLGKTVQTLALLAKAIEESEDRRASLIAMPASLVHNWAAEIEKFLPTAKVFVYYGAARISAEQFGEYDFILISYGLLRNDIALFEQYEFLYTVLDESQAIKNSTSKLYNAVLKLNTRFRLSLTGTPLENSLNDLWSQMNFLNHNMLGNNNFFKNTFLKPIEQNSETERDLLRQMIAPFILRRDKREVAPDLPPVTEQCIYCAMDEDQAALYEEEKSKARNLIYENIEENGLGNSSFQILQAIMSLRQLACHPVMFDAKQKATSGKFATVVKHLETILGEKHKVLMFSSFTKHLELFEEYFRINNISYSILTGSTGDRKSAVEQFENNPDCQVFLISLKAGGVGLNLTSADYVFMLDPWWNPAAEQQAVARAHRIGQDKPVFVYRFIAESTIEEKIITLQERKMELAELFVNNNTASLNLTDLQMILQ